MSAVSGFFPGDGNGSAWMHGEAGIGKTLSITASRAAWEAAPAAAPGHSIERSASAEQGDAS
ncbi:hypothetical protein [Nonomuraea guangzhouensis]|uniref:ATP-binding protein n=1 Tax=Nonomuraea guangzhouensis TaxID=1291555 RepID=A0ABW4GU74_9ACTN|nr:hypothetical protein [Nonomuraea guangzhouensis]